MVPNYHTPYLHAFDALRSLERSRVRSVLPAWMNPYPMPLLQQPADACGPDCYPTYSRATCSPVNVLNPERSKLPARAQTRAQSGW